MLTKGGVKYQMDKIFSIIKMCVDFLQNLIESIIVAKKDKKEEK